MQKQEQVMIIGIAGGTGSGKTTLAQHIADAFGDRVTIIAHDSYYRAQHDKTKEERSRQNYDHPDAFETDLLCHHLDLYQPREAGAVEKVRIRDLFSPV